MGTLKQYGESFRFCFDSAAECSLIKEAASLSISGTRVGNVVILGGIGNSTVCSTSKILANVILS